MIDILNYFAENSCKTFRQELKGGWLEGWLLIVLLCGFLLLGKVIAKSILYGIKLFRGV